MSSAHHTAALPPPLLPSRLPSLPPSLLPSLPPSLPPSFLPSVPTSLLQTVEETPSPVAAFGFRATGRGGQGFSVRVWGAWLSPPTSSRLLFRGRSWGCSFEGEFGVAASKESSGLLLRRMVWDCSFEGEFGVSPSKKGFGFGFEVYGDKCSGQPRPRTPPLLNSNHNPQTDTPNPGRTHTHTLTSKSTSLTLKPIPPNPKPPLPKPCTPPTFITDHPGRVVTDEGLSLWLDVFSWVVGTNHSLRRIPRAAMLILSHNNCNFRTPTPQTRSPKPCTLNPFPAD